MNKKLLSLFFICVLWGCSSDDNLPENPDGKDPENPNNVVNYFDRDYVIINELKWDIENLEGYYTYEEAAEIAEKLGKRVPTIDELLAIGKGCDGDNYGLWVGKDMEKSEYSEYSIYIPQSGYHLTRDDFSGTLYVKERAYLLSSSYFNGDLLGYAIFAIYSSGGPKETFHGDNRFTTYRFPVRLVQDMDK